MQINKLIIVSGVSGVGKTTLINKLSQGEYPDIQNKLGIERSSSLCIKSLRNLQEMNNLNDLNAEFLVVHLDIYYQFEVCKNDFLFISNLINKSSSTTVLTLYTSQKILQKRISKRILNNLFTIKSRYKDFIRGIAIYKKIKKLIFYKNGLKLLNLYAVWFELIQHKDISTHLVVDSSKELITLEVFKNQEYHFQKYS